MADILSHLRRCANFFDCLTGSASRIRAFFSQRLHSSLSSREFFKLFTVENACFERMKMIVPNVFRCEHEPVQNFSFFDVQRSSNSHVLTIRLVRWARTSKTSRNPCTSDGGASRGAYRRQKVFATTFRPCNPPAYLDLE
jgi:hypothetical protein